LLEWHGARQTPADDVITDINKRLDGERWVVLYGHPCYEGVNDGILRRVFRAALERGFRFVTHQQMVERLHFK